ncbi:MAG: response regulator transcription factor [Acidobacteriaceae bacterium]
MTSEEGQPARRFGVVAADPLRLLGLETIFAEVDGVELVPLTGSGALNSAPLDLMFVDASCTEHLFELLAAFQRARPRLKVIVIGLETDHDHMQRVIGAGAKGYLTHGSNAAEIRMAVEIVLDGSVWAPRTVMARLLEAGRRAEAEAAAAPPRFTPREEDVLRLLVAGRSNREIGKSLKVNEATVKAHVGRLLRKVGVENRTALTMAAMQRGLLKSGG